MHCYRYIEEIRQHFDLTVPLRSLIIENKDYNYTLIITGTTFMILHHDTNKNATYSHGIEVIKANCSKILLT